MNSLQEPSPIPTGSAAVPRIKYDRTWFDYVILAFAYLFMPIGLVLALLRLIFTHFKNYRRPTNLNLLMHVFIGGFVELSIAILSSALNGEVKNSEFVFMIIFLAVIFLTPAFIMASVTAKAKYTLSKINTSYLELIQNQNIRHVGTLSQRTGLSENDVWRDVQVLKEKGQLDMGIILSEGHQTPGSSTSAPDSHSRRMASSSGTERAQSYGQPTSGQPRLPKSVNCPGCGAQNTVLPGQSTSCDYCGTTIPYE